MEEPYTSSPHDGLLVTEVDFLGLVEKGKEEGKRRERERRDHCQKVGEGNLERTTLRPLCARSKREERRRSCINGISRRQMPLRAKASQVFLALMFMLILPYIAYYDVPVCLLYKLP